jgi:hypothetical protein
MTDFPIYWVIESACAGFSWNYDRSVLSLLPINEATLVNIKDQLTRNDWNGFFDQPNMAIQTFERLYDQFSIRIPAIK